VGLGCLAATAICTKDSERRKTALKVLKILTGYGSSRKQPGGTQ
jgi:hypothetical protein